MRDGYLLVSDNVGTAIDRRLMFTMTTLVEPLHSSVAHVSKSDIRWRRK